MRLFSSLALKNIFRYRARSFIVITTIAISVFIAIIVDLLLIAMNQQSVQNITKYETSEYSICKSNYLEDDIDKSDKLITKQVSDHIKNKLNEEQIAASLVYTDLAELIFYNNDDNFENNFYIQVKAVDNLYDTVFPIKNDIIEGSWIGEETGNKIVVGSSLVQNFGLKVGDTVLLNIISPKGFAEIIDFEISGILHTENINVNANTVYVPYGIIDTYLDLGGQGNIISLGLEHHGLSLTRNTKKMNESVSTFKDMKVFYYEEFYPDFKELSKADSSSSYLILLFLFIICAVGIANIVLMSIFERRKECGMMLSLGYSGLKIRGLFFKEGIWIGLIGSLIGVVLAFFTNIYLFFCGVDLSVITDNQNIANGLPYRIAPVLYASFNIKPYILIPILAVILSGIVSYMVIHNFLKKDIADLLREV